MMAASTSMGITDDEFMQDMLGIIEVTEKYIDILERKIVNKKEKRASPKFWVKEHLLDHETAGEFHTSMKKMRTHNPEEFKGYYRTTPRQFDDLLALVKDELEKRSNRMPISPAEMLAMTLRYLASGDLIKTIALNFLVGKETARRCIYQTCDALYKVLQPIYLPQPTLETWKSTAERFETQWQFPHCLGAVDGKHVVIQCPPKSGSQFHNYKGTFSIVLMAVADANYKFLYVDVGGFGHQSDGGIFKDCSLGKLLASNSLEIPQPRKLSKSKMEPCPYVFIGDEAFQLTDYFLRPFPGKELDCNRRVFNYRLSRARRCVENAFGILVSRFRLFHKPINILPENVERVVLASIVLHNFLLRPDHASTYCGPGFTDSEDALGNVIHGNWRLDLAESSTSAMKCIPASKARKFSRSADNVRKQFVDHFVSSEGEVHWQWTIPGLYLAPNGK